MNILKKNKDLWRFLDMPTLVKTLIVLSIVSGLICSQFKNPYYKEVVASAYCPCDTCCGKHSDGMTATGNDAMLPGVAVDPDIIPLGSRMDIPGYNRGVNGNGSWILCDDTGSAIKGNKIDVRFKTHEEALEWGVKKIRVRIHPK